MALPWRTVATHTAQHVAVCVRCGYDHPRAAARVLVPVTAPHTVQGPVLAA